MCEQVNTIINSYNDDYCTFKNCVYSLFAMSAPYNFIFCKIRLVISTVENDPCVKILNDPFVKKHNLDIEIHINDKPGIYYQLNNAVEYIKDRQGWFMYFSGTDYCICTKAINEISLCREEKTKICYSNFFCRKTLSSGEISVPRATDFGPYDYGRHLRGNYISDVSIVSMDILRKYAPFNSLHGNFAFWDFWLRVYEGEGNVFSFNPHAEWVYNISPNSKHIKRKGNPEEIEKYNSIRERMINSHVNKTM